MMLTRTNKLSAFQLGIKQEELDALLLVRAWLAGGAPYDTITDFSGDPLEFRMEVVATSHNCGTACCIGGAMGLAMGLDVYNANEYVLHRDKDALRELFMATELDYAETQWSLDMVTPAMALKAVDNFLNSGHAHWDEVVAEKETKC
jgi:hypothetical protein